MSNFSTQDLNHSETQAAPTWSFRHGHYIHLSMSYIIVYYYYIYILKNTVFLLQTVSQHGLIYTRTLDL